MNPDIYYPDCIRINFCIVYPDLQFKKWIILYDNLGFWRRYNIYCLKCKERYIGLYQKLIDLNWYYDWHTIILWLTFNVKKNFVKRIIIDTVIYSKFFITLSSKNILVISETDETSDVFEELHIFAIINILICTSLLILVTDKVTHII